MPCGRQCAFSSSRWWLSPSSRRHRSAPRRAFRAGSTPRRRSEEHTSELQSQSNIVCRLLLEKKKMRHIITSDGKAPPLLLSRPSALQVLVAAGCPVIPGTICCIVLGINRTAYTLLLTVVVLG